MTSWALSSYCRPGMESRSRAFAVKPADAAAIRAKGTLFAVVDGSVSPALSDKVSEAVGQSLLRYYYSAETGRDPQIALRLAVQRAVSMLDSLRPAGSAPLVAALAAGVVWQDELLLARVGDAAALLLRNGHAISLSPEAPDFDSILESSLPLMTGDRVALCTAAAVTHLPTALDRRHAPSHAALLYRNAAAADPAIAHAAIAVFDFDATPAAAMPTPPPAPLEPSEAAPPAVPVEPAAAPPPPVPVEPPAAKPASVEAPAAPAPVMAEPTPPAAPAAPADAAPTPSPAESAHVTPPAAPAEPPLDAVPPTMPRRRRRRFPFLLLVLLGALVGATAYFYNYPSDFAVVRTQAESVAGSAMSYVAHAVAGSSEPPQVVVIESPLASPTASPAPTADDRQPTASPALTATASLAASPTADGPPPTATPALTATASPTASPTAGDRQPTASPTATATPSPTASPTVTPSPTAQSIGEVVRELPTATVLPTRRPAASPTADGPPPTAMPTTAASPTADSRPPTATATAEEPLPEGAFPPLPTPPP